MAVRGRPEPMEKSAARLADAPVPELATPALTRADVGEDTDLGGHQHLGAQESPEQRREGPLVGPPIQGMEDHFAAPVGIPGKKSASPLQRRFPPGLIPTSASARSRRRWSA